MEKFKDHALQKLKQFHRRKRWKNLYERAVQIQSQLNPSNQDDGHLFEVLRTAIEDQLFYTFVECTKQSSSDREYVQDCLHAIDKQAHQDKLRGTRSLITNVDSTAYPSSVSHAPPLLESTYIATAKRNIAEALYTKVGRRYGTDNRVNKFDRKNPFKFGKHMLCRGCKSDSHLIRDCRTIRKADLVNYVLQTGEDAAHLTIDQLLDTIQDLPDDVWLMTCENIIAT